MHACCDSLRRSQFLGALGAAVLAGCSTPLPFAPASSNVTLLTNGNVITLGKQLRARSVAIAGGKILATATDNQTLHRKYPHASVHDLGGATLAPGFVEAHAHISQTLLDLVSHNLAACHTLDELGDRLSNLVKSPNENGWVYGQGIDESLLHPHFRPPTLEFLNGISATVPIFIEDSTGHLYYVNQAALDIVRKATHKQVRPGTAFPGGGLVGGRGNGLKGIVYEFATGPFLKYIVPPTPQELRRAIYALLKKAQRNGITTWHDPAAGLFSGDVALDLNNVYEPIAADPYAPVRLMSSLILTDAAQKPHIFDHPRRHPGAGFFYGDSRALWVPALKIWVDGTPQGETARVTAPYNTTPPTTGFPKGRLDWTPSELASWLTRAFEHGWSALLHTNGDEAIQVAIEAVRASYGPRIPDGFRVRFEHLTISTRAQIEEMKTIGITPTFLNNHTYLWGDAFSNRIIGPARAARLDAAGDCVRNDMHFSFHCDYGVSQPQPLRYMQTAVTRTTRYGSVIGPDQAISPLEALKGCTIYPAIQLGFSERIGSIETGKDADFVELAHDPLAWDHKQIADIPVHATWRQGVRIST